MARAVYDDFPRVVGGSGGEVDVPGFFGEQLGDALGPFDGDNSVVVAQIVFEAQPEGVGRAAHAVTVNVREGQASAIFVDERKGGTADGAADAQPLRHALHKARFPGAQIAVQTQHGAGFEGRGDLRGEGAGFLGGVRDVRLAVAWHGALADRKRAALASVHFSLFSFSGICATIRGNGNDGSFACTAGVAGL